MKVIKRNGESQIVSFDKVISRISNLCKMEPVCDRVDPIKVAQQVCSRIYDNVKTTDLDELAAQICVSLITTDLQYAILASRIIISNTTDKNRENLTGSYRNEEGGLSGKPLGKISNDLIKKFYKETKGEIQIIGVGGVDSGQAAFEKISAGANAVQLYTGMVYKGPGVVKDIKKELISILKKENLKNIGEAVGINA